MISEASVGYHSNLWERVFGTARDIKLKSNADIYTEIIFVSYRKSDNFLIGYSLHWVTLDII